MDPDDRAYEEIWRATRAPGAGWGAYEVALRLGDGELAEEVLEQLVDTWLANPDPALGRQLVEALSDLGDDGADQRFFLGPLGPCAMPMIEAAVPMSDSMSGSKLGLSGVAE